MYDGVTRWWLIRHAPVVGVEGKIYGADDVECDLSDLQSFQNLARRLPGDVPWYTSHLSRAKLTARSIRDAGLETRDPVIDERFAEQSFGDWQGSSWNEMRDADPVTYDAFWQDPVRNRTPNGESFADQIARVGAAIDEYTEKHAGSDIVCVSHGGTVRAAISHALGLDPSAGMALTVHTLSLSVIEHVPDGLLRGRGGAWRVVHINRPAREDH
ncbi:MAG: histidine phosphatase family protein [Rhodospirillales bacterium]|nr:histidine phosphatase family protein [Rhodospirillales bacterium]MBO6788446.1 histidine phosphatase family protein [Rhodospirillales bacterium]